MKKILFCLFVSSIFANEICAQITHQNTQDSARISNLNTEVELPGILPVALYLEVLSSGNLKNQYFNSAKSPFIYNGGLCLDVKLAKIYVNLFQSENITSSQQIQGINDLSEKMAFIFDLNKILRKPKVGFHPFNEQ